VTETILFLEACLAGFIVAVPIGAVGAICIRLALGGRLAVATATGLGAAVADAALAAIALFGLAVLANRLADAVPHVHVAGGLVLVVLGAAMVWRRRVVVDGTTVAEVSSLRQLRDMAGAVSAGFALTIVNPATLVSFFAVFAVFGLTRAVAQLGHGTLVVAGAFAGSLLWWMTLAVGFHVLRHHVPDRLVVAINVALGLLVAGLGAATLVSPVSLAP